MPGVRHHTAWDPPHGLTRWGDGCSFVFLDIGSNMGVSVRKLFEPEAYPQYTSAEYEYDFGWLLDLLYRKNRSKTHHDTSFPGSYTATFDRVFEPAETRRRSNFQGYCAFGFEPNPYHTSRLRAIEECYTSRGWRVKFFTETAVADVDGEVWLRSSKRAVGLHNIAASTVQTKLDTADEEADANFTRAEGVDLARWLRFHVSQRRVPLGRSAVYAKLDVEGAEFQVLPRMLMMGLLCNKTIAELTLEWHPTMWANKDNERLALATSFKEHLSEFAGMDARNCVPTRIRDAEDESYMHDTTRPNLCSIGQGWPHTRHSPPPSAPRAPPPRHKAM